MTHLPAPAPTRVHRCHNCGRRVSRYTGDSIETGWSLGKPVEDDDSCALCWPSVNLRDAMDAAVTRERGW